MRVYLEKGQTVETKRGAKRTFSGEAFYEVGPELGAKWIKEGVAKPATERNEVIEQPAKAELPEPKADKPHPKKPEPKADKPKVGKDNI